MSIFKNAIFDGIPGPGPAELIMWLVVVTIAAIVVIFWGGSALLVLLTPRPTNPWESQPVPPGGEYLRVSDGAEIFLRHWLPNGPVQQVVLGLHGIGNHSGYHHRAGEAFADAGIAYYAVDLRGNGLTRTPHGDLPSERRLYDDLDDVLGQLAQRHPEARLYALGHSLGGAMAIVWAAKRRPPIARLIILAPAMTADVVPIPWVNYLRGPAATLFFRHRAVLRIGTRGYDLDRLQQLLSPQSEAEYVANDPLHLQAMSMELAMASGRARKEATGLAPQVTVPTLVLVGEADPARVGAQAFFTGLQVADKQYVEIPQATHMLFQIEETPAVMRSLTDWLAAH